jgi:tetratricopeptide (TPR) repeat protein
MMLRNENSNLTLLLVLVAILLILTLARRAAAVEPEGLVCDIRADYALGVEDYKEAIRLHREILRKDPGNALAHYHLGFAEGMIGNRAAEIEEYRRAEAQGLRIWDLFLNLGLAQAEAGDLHAAMQSQRMAVILGEEHPEAHYDLALTEEHLGMLVDAEHEVETSLRLSPGQPDARNLLGVIYAREGKTARAAQIWRNLIQETPDYQPARTNLSFLSSRNSVAETETAAVASSPAAAVRTLKESGSNAR